MFKVFLKHFLILICLSLFFFSFETYSQNFPKNRKKFISYVQKSYSHIEKTYVQNFIKGPLKKHHRPNGIIDDSYFNKIVDYCNNLEDREIKTFPGIFYYLNTTYYLKDKQDEFQNWEAILDKHLEFGNKIRSTTFLNFHISFLNMVKLEMQKEANGL